MELDVAGGRIRGASDGGVNRFFGIPYAAPPVGELRFEAPQAHPGWSGVRDATARGPTAPHAVRPFPGIDVEPLIGAGWSPGDDFLTLNIWAPAGGVGRPVLVFIHGGAFVLGSKDAAVHDGSAFARSGVVCVAINYRLGVEGFLPIPGAATNLGLRDQLAALAWVRDNIAAFGGDPTNVTVSGESAGAMSVADLVASPLAKGLFGRAIIQSGHGAMVRSLKVAAKLTRRVARVLGVPASRAGFASASMERCVEAVMQVSLPTTLIDLREADGREPAFGLSRFLPVWGDDVLPEPPLNALAKGAGAYIEVLIGTNREEMNLYFVPSGVREALGALPARLLLGRVQPRAGEVLADYGMKAKGRKAGEVFTRAMTDLVFRWPARRFAETHRGRTHMYEFDWRSPACDGELGACHGIELPFVFDTLASTTGPQGLAGPSPPQELADRTHRIWVDFVTTGAAPWPQYMAQDRQVFSLELGRAVVEPPAPAARHLP